MNSLVFRLTIAFVLIAAVIVVLVIVSINHAIDNSFRTYLTRNSAIQNNSMMISELEDHYAATGLWADVDGILMPGQGNQHGRGQGRNEDRGAQLVVADADYKIIASTNTDLIGQKLDDSLQAGSVPIQVDGKIVGHFLRLTSSNELIALTEETFLNEIRNALGWTSLAALVGTLVLGITFAWWLARPLRRLTVATQAVASGRLGVSVPISGAKDIQQVAEAFNQMSASLAESEYSRKRMISDIAHELRTPLSVMRGQLEGMMDGVINADTQHIGTVYNQTLQLSRLVADLWTLTRAEAKSLSLEKSPTDLEEFIDNISREFEPLAQDGLIQLQVQVEPNLPRITLDQGRMRQVLSNLLVNALRHTPQGGQITLLAGCRDSKMVMSVGDTGEGLSSEDVQHIFERFFRTDRSRQRQYGGAGLGLAIARELVVLHGGDIAVESRIGLGTSFTITLPFV